MAATCNDEDDRHSVKLSTLARRCPWTLTDTNTHDVALDNQRSFSLHNIEILVEATYKLVEVQDPSNNVFSHSVLYKVPGVVSSKGTLPQPFGLQAPATSAGRTEEMTTVAAFHYATRRHGSKRKRTTTYELKLN